VTSTLNKLGAQGWELASMAPANAPNRYLVCTSRSSRMPTQPTITADSTAA
jgi:hypothetical protein